MDLLVSIAGIAIAERGSFAEDRNIGGRLADDAEADSGGGGCGGGGGDQEERQEAEEGEREMEVEVIVPEGHPACKIGVEIGQREGQRRGGSLGERSKKRENQSGSHC